MLSGCVSLGPPHFPEKPDNSGLSRSPSKKGASPWTMTKTGADYQGFWGSWLNTGSDMGNKWGVEWDAGIRVWNPIGFPAMNRYLYTFFALNDGPMLLLPSKPFEIDVFN